MTEQRTAILRRHEQRIAAALSVPPAILGPPSPPPPPLIVQMLHLGYFGEMNDPGTRRRVRVALGPEPEDEAMKSMLCTYCLVRKPWNREHFPDRMAATCSDCITAQKNGS